MKKLILLLFISFVFTCSNDDDNSSATTIEGKWNLTSQYINGIVQSIDSCTLQSYMLLSEQGSGLYYIYYSDFPENPEIEPCGLDVTFNVNSSYITDNTFSMTWDYGGGDIENGSAEINNNTLIFTSAYDGDNYETIFTKEFSNDDSNENNSQGFNIGDLAYGGIVFWIDPADNTKGLVSALQDQAITQWGCKGIYINNATETTIGSGLSNTNAIIDNCTETEIAAKICNDLTLNGYNDWFLPSKDELNLMYMNLHLNGLGNFENGDGNCCIGWYWSSSDGETNGDAAWVQSFRDGHNGMQATYDIGIKDNDNHVRAIRKF